MSMTNLIRNLMRRKYVWYNDKTDRRDRTRWKRVIRRYLKDYELVILAQDNDGEYVIFTYLTSWDNPKFIPSDSWVGQDKTVALEAFEERTYPSWATDVEQP